MKSFGVRLGAGLVTIIFGAYAAALAQKDKQNGNSTWSGEAPSLGQPAAPIADFAGADSGGDSWSRGAEAAAALVNHRESHDDVFSQGGVALVDHTEEITHGNASGGFASPVFSPPVDGQASAIEAPASLGTPDPVAGDMEWAMPPAVDQSAGYEAENVQGERSLSMTFPSEAPAGQAAPPAGAASATNMPAFSMTAMPDVEYFDEGQAPVAQEYPADNDAPESYPADNLAAAQGNMLRDSGDTNQLRGDVPPQPPVETYAAPMPMNTPAPRTMSMAAAPPAYESAPAARDQYADQLAAQAPPARMASLPSGYDTAPTGYAQPETGYQPQAFAQPAGAIAIDPNSVVDSPGDRRLDGVQTPSVVIHKRAPSQVTVGKPASFVIQVQNVGAVEALDVNVHDRIPAGMRLVDASPAPVQQGSLLMWQLGAMPAGDERTLTMQLIAETEGELGSTARVSFEAAASVRTISTRPELKIVQRAPDKVLIGQQLEIELEFSNPGTGPAANVSLQEDVPSGLEHPKGRQLDNLIGTLAPGETRSQILRLKAVSPGMIQNVIRLVSEDGLTAEHAINVEVVAPQLAIQMTGPSRRYLERQATYQLEVANTGTADATNVEIAVQLDRGFTFVSTDYEGHYDPSRHSVIWSLAMLQAGKSGSVPLTLLPVEVGERAITIDARADLGVVAKSERAVSVEGIAELSFQIVNPGGPIELGAESSYEITVVNSGSMADENVRVELHLPAGLELIAADGDAGTDGRGLVAFQPRAQLLPGAEMKHRVRVRGVAPGTHLVKAVVVSNHANKPVSKEESTLVYADQ
ncbi:DUF11 domain-containing protein [Rubripirellula reticaptiva]|uniref:Large cysteine-rich periplasmic protein OmcB n=1 Tax=Rubripirellula reticaptiva TaxID=2528013 RepID=A0A5C6EUZ9_9BACT|nr:DUF11 domain-containing protein [Rubripirellula reticaptiva]TWU51131.1 Large cysteine-rich periplasmic protein OmcB precursor [Rubripirellula reticaptiva]